MPIAGCRGQLSCCQADTSPDGEFHAELPYDKNPSHMRCQCSLTTTFLWPQALENGSPCPPCLSPPCLHDTGQAIGDLRRHVYCVVHQQEGRRLYSSAAATSSPLDWANDHQNMPPSSLVTKLAGSATQLTSTSNVLCGCCTATKMMNQIRFLIWRAACNTSSEQHTM